MRVGFMPMHYFERVVALLGEPAGLVRNIRRSTITATSRASCAARRSTGRCRSASMAGTAKDATAALRSPQRPERNRAPVRFWWDHMVGLDLVRRYGVQTKAPQLEEWGLVAALTDPSGVLWRFAEIPAQNSLKRGARTGAYLRPCISRISSTGQTGAVVPVHCATVFASKRSSLRRSLIFARISSR